MVLAEVYKYHRTRPEHESMMDDVTLCIAVGMMVLLSSTTAPLKLTGALRRLVMEEAWITRYGPSSVRITSDGLDRRTYSGNNCGAVRRLGVSRP